MACCAVGAYIVFRFLKLHEWLSTPFQTKQSTLADPCDYGREPELWSPSEKPQPAPIPRQQEHTVQGCVLVLGGLTCGSCVSEVQRIIEDVPGVVRASVSLSLLRAHVTFTPETSPGSIADAIQVAGYDALLLSTAQDPDSWSEVASTVQQSAFTRGYEIRNWRHAFFVSALCSSTVAVARYLSSTVFPGLRQNVSVNLIISLAVALSLAAGSSIHLETARCLWHRRKANMSTLGSLGTAMVLIQAATVGVKTGRQQWLYQPELDVIPILTTSILGGRLLKAIVSERSLDFGTPLISLIPTTALVYRGREAVTSDKVPTTMLAPGDRLYVRQGDRLPCDGVLDSSSSALVLETWISGSTIPRAVAGGDTVLAGSRVEQGDLVLEVTACGRSTQLGKVLESIISAELASGGDRAQDSALTRYFVTAIVVLVAAVGVFHLLCNPDVTLEDVLRRSSAMLLAACPCTFSLSIPTAKLLATVRASKAGVRLATDSKRMKGAATAGTILFDKTGTLTRGVLRVTQTIHEDNWRIGLWDAIRDLETDIRHPVAQAITSEAAQQTTNHAPEIAGLGSTKGKVTVTEILHELGRGVKGVVKVSRSSRSESWTLAIGSPAYMESLGVRVNLVRLPTELRNAMITPVIVAVDGVQAGILVLEDEIRPDAVSTIRGLKNMGLEVGMVTGDNYASAIATSRRVGIDVGMVFSGCLPGEKADIVRRFRRQGPTVFVGDNLNDIPSFQSASFSIYVPDAWSPDHPDLADATLMPHTAADRDSDEVLGRVLFLVKLSRRTLHIVTQNFRWAVFYNTISLLGAAGAFGQMYPSSSVVASVRMGFSGIVVLLNSSRIGNIPC